MSAKSCSRRLRNSSLSRRPCEALSHIFLKTMRVFPSSCRDFSQESKGKPKNTRRCTRYRQGTQVCRPSWESGLGPQFLTFHRAGDRENRKEKSNAGSQAPLSHRKSAFALRCYDLGRFCCLPSQRCLVDCHDHHAGDRQPQHGLLSNPDCYRRQRHGLQVEHRLRSPTHRFDTGHYRRNHRQTHHRRNFQIPS